MNIYRDTLTIVLLATVLFSTSCNMASNEKASPLYRVMLDEQIPEKGIDNLFDKLQISKIAPLETTENSTINVISDVKSVNDKIYVLDKRQQTLFIFDVQGEFLRKLSKQGRGPSEYIGIEHYDVNENGDIIVVDLRGGGKIISYDANCNPKTNFSIDSHVTNIAFLDDSTICVSSEAKANDQPTVNLYDLNGKSLTCGVVMPNEYNTIIASHYDGVAIFKNSNSQLSFKPSFSNKLYEISREDMTCLGDIKLLDRTNLEDAMYSNVAQMADIETGGFDYLNTKYNTILTRGTGYIENDDFILSLVEYKSPIDTYKYLYYDKNTKKSSIHIANKVSRNAPFYELIYNDKRDYSLLDMVNLHAVSGNQFVSKIYPANIAQILEKPLPTGAAHNVKAVYNKLKTTQITENDNPILIFFRK